MRDGLEDGAEEDAVAAELDEVVQPRLEAGKAVRGILCVANGGTRRAKGVDVPPDGVYELLFHGISLSSADNVQNYIDIQCM